MIRFAQVIAVHPSRRSVALVMLDDGSRYAEARVLDTAASDSGFWAVPSVALPRRETEAGGISPNGRTLNAAVALCDGRAVVIGFISPLNGMAVTEQDRAVYRHPSGAYMTIGPDGSMEAFHPSGTYFRIGEGEHAAVPGLAAVPPGAAPAQVTLQTADVKLTVKPGGEVELTTSGMLKMSYASAELTGDIALSGTLTATNDVVAGGISLRTHRHGGVQAGTAQTGVPA